MLRFLDLEKFEDNATIISNIDNREISKLHFDSRKINSEHGSIFFALKSDSNDGHNYLESAYERGVRQFVISEETSFTKSINDKSNIVLVNDSLSVLQKIAANHRREFQIPIIAITGSNGKTITKEWLSLLLSAEFKVVKNPGSYNSQIGVPLSVWNIKEEDDIGIFEAGISEPNEMSRLEEIISPTIGLLTNIGTAHDSGFDSEDSKIAEKLKLFRGVKKLIYRSDNEKVNTLISENYSHEKVDWSTAKNSTASYPVTWETLEDGSKITVRKESFFCSFKDRASLENATHCIVTALELSFSHNTIRSGLRLFKNLQKRLYITPGINHCSLVEDYYNNDLAGIEIALDFIKQYDRGASKTIILSDIPQITNAQKKDTYQKIGQLLDSHNFSRIIGIGKDIQSIEPFFNGHKEFYPSTTAFIEQFKPHSFHQESILIKGAREFHFENIAELLQEKAHHTQLTINLNSAVQNLSYFKKKAGSAKIMGMVKALAYGSGAIEIAQLLQFNQVDYLGVAYTDEGRQLRSNGITIPIMVMNVHQDDLDLIFKYDLDAEIYSMNLLKILDNYTSETGNKINIHLKIDTGMNRLGFKPDEIDQVIEILRTNSLINVKGCFSHLASAEANPEFTEFQNSNFNEATSRVEQALNKEVLKHLLNSAGILRYPELRYDMVRLGIGIYGLDPSKEYQRDLIPVNQLKTVVSQVKTLGPGDTVGYGRVGEIHHPTDVATIAIGYADGFHRSLGNGKGSVLINGHRAKTIGNVCMDMTMIDVTGLEVSEGDEVEVFGVKNPIQEIASSAQTIPYEILTSVSPRVKRIYTYE